MYNFMILLTQGFNLTLTITFNAT